MDEIRIELFSQDGLMLSIHDSDTKKHDKMQAILWAYTLGFYVQSRHRNGRSWERMDDIPCNFSDYAYRVVS